MKKFFLLAGMFVCTFGFAQESPQEAPQESTEEGQVDPVAVLILDKMSDLIGDLESCTFSLSTRHDVDDPDNGWVTHHSTSTLMFDGPDKMHVHRNGEKGQEGFWYNGEEVSYYSYDQNNFVRIPASAKSLSGAAALVLSAWGAQAEVGREQEGLTSQTR